MFVMEHGMYGKNRKLLAKNRRRMPENGRRGGSLKVLHTGIKRLFQQAQKFPAA